MNELLTVTLNSPGPVGLLMLRLTRSVVRAVFLIVLATQATHADVVCPPVFGDHMVLQRDRPIVIWGSAAPGERVTAKFAGSRASVNASQEGVWRIQLPSHQADPTGRILSIRGKNTLTFTDVLVGEVWLCSGQSNMEKPFGPRKGQKPTDNSAEEIAQANHPFLRLFQVPHSSKPKPDDGTMQWLACSPETLAKTEFSAAAYFFGRELNHELNVPVGLIHASFGGTQIEAWMPPQAFASRPALAPLANLRYPAWVEGVQATELFQSMIAPLAPFGLRGFLWYQGEANCMMAEGPLYTEKMAALITSWRGAWNDSNAPFYFALLAPFDYSRWDTFPKRLTPEELPIFWEAQAAALAEPNTGLVVTTDLVANLKDIHPTNKRDVGLRFARLALADTYGRANGEAHSPQFASFRPADHSRLELSFRHTGGHLSTRDKKPPTEFSIAGADGKFLPATAEITGDKIVVWNDELSSPSAVRFGWHETAVSNLVNASGLPVVPFRTDTWPVVTERPKP